MRETVAAYKQVVEAWNEGLKQVQNRECYTTALLGAMVDYAGSKLVLTCINEAVQFEQTESSKQRRLK